MAVVLVAAVVSVTMWWLGRPEGDRALDESAQRMADAVSYPRQRSAAGLLNAVLDQQEPQGQWAVLRAEDLEPSDLLDWMAELVIHHHQDALDSPTFGLRRHQDAWDACYRLKFTHYRGEAERIHCPDDLTPLPRSESAPPPYPVAVCRSGGDSSDCPGG
ncbi:hypothetical protein LWF15_05685 [Kineosporia rhizophila]|uniref:hypothetical protein n=1 Tax=Kineosporia TaxID=49184 RepID=UPI001E360718|nr:MULTISPECIES: hypothetical protein [Kineosporia]MCE0534994.1 hypothetical protein [Kineosporia rhizophila]GLY14722.1 hypothetical protein Kisp01_17370 [Kineosporia sp. NBRC 101677]